MSFWSRLLRGREAPVSKETPAAPKKSSVFTNALSAAASRAGAKKESVAVFGAPDHPPAVGPKSGKFAFDNNIADSQGWSNTNFSAYGVEGVTFLGYAYLSELAQRPEYRVIAETIATEMTRKWIKFTSKDDEETDGPDAEKTKSEKRSKRIKELEAEFERLNVRDLFCRVTEQDGYFGRGHIYVDTGDTDNPDELKKSIGDGWDEASSVKVSPKRPIKSLRTVEAVWCYPTSYNSNDPLKDDWYRPNEWYVQAKVVHSSRLLTFIGREVPDLLKPSYSFGGLALTQMAMPYVNNWLSTRQGVNDIINAFSVFVLGTNLGESLQGDGQQLFDRAQLFNNLRNNSGLMLIDKDSENFQNVAAPLGGLHELQAQAQEHMAAVSHIPLVKLLGIQPAGLNASSEGELRSFYDYIHSFQEHLFRPKLRRLLGLIMWSLWGEVDESIGFEFEPLWALNEKEAAEVAKTKAETGQILIDGGTLSQEEERKRVAGDPDTPYAGLDVDDMPDLLEEEEEGLEPMGGRPDPNLTAVGTGAAPPANQNKPKKPPKKAGAADAVPFDPATTSLSARRLYAKLAMDDAFNDADHPHAPAGSPKGGQFVSSGGGGGSSAAKAAPAPGSFNAAMKKISALKKSDKKLVHVMMHNILGNKDEVSGPETFHKAMKLLSAKTPKEKKAFAETLNALLDAGKYKHESVTEENLGEWVAETDTPGGKPVTESEAVSKASMESVDVLNYANNLDYMFSSSEDTLDGYIIKAKKGSNSELTIEPDGSWALETEGHMAKQGKGGQALEALLTGGDWASKGVTNFTGESTSNKVTAPETAPTPVSTAHHDLRNRIAKVRPKPTDAQQSAISNYKGSGYGAMNDKLRNTGTHTASTKAMHEWLEGASLPEDATLWRGIKGEYSKILKSILDEGTIFRDRGFISTSTHADFSAQWAEGHGGATGPMPNGNMLMRIDVKKGQKGAAIRSADSGDSEYEVVLQDDSRLKVVSIDWEKGHVHCELVQL